MAYCRNWHNIANQLYLEIKRKKRKKEGRKEGKKEGKKERKEKKIKFSGSDGQSSFQI